MEFISLHYLMEELATNQTGEEAERYSRAAAGLYQVMHNAIASPSWFETHRDTGMLLRSDNAITEGMAMLLHMAGWKMRDIREFLQHVDDCTKSGLDPADVPRGYNMAGGMYDMKNYTKSMAIGFDRAELVLFLNENGIEHNLRDVIFLLHAKTELNNAEAIKGWYDEIMDAKYWLGINALSPREAAMLLCQYNPRDTLDPENHSNEETNKDDYKRLLRAFEDEAQDISKDLRVWRDIAKNKGLKYHSWIDSYLGNETVNTVPDVAGVEPIGVDTPAPWLTPNPTDPNPKQKWYIPARYFARELVKSDTSLLGKRGILCTRIVKQLTQVGINKRGGVLDFNPDTIKKALTNIKLG